VTRTVSGRPPLNGRERDALQASAVAALVRALDALVNPGGGGDSVATALLNTGTALLRIAQLDVNEAAKTQVLLALESISNAPKA